MTLFDSTERPGIQQACHHRCKIGVGICRQRRNARITQRNTQAARVEERAVRGADSERIDRVAGPHDQNALTSPDEIRKRIGGRVVTIATPD